MKNYFKLFIQSRQAIRVTQNTLVFYQNKIGKFLAELDPDTVQRQDIERYLMRFKNPGNCHAHFRVLRTFFNWREETFGHPSPMGRMKAPKVPKKILPTLTKEQIMILINSARKIRDKAIISLFAESGLRLSELTNIDREDISLCNRIIKVWIKGQKEAYATYGDRTAKYLDAWFDESQPSGNIWDLTQWGIISMLRRLEQKTGINCNPHVFRRSFACLLRERVLNTLAIKDLGRWETTAMVELYTRSMGFNDSLKFYQGPLSENPED